MLYARDSGYSNTPSRASTSMTINRNDYGEVKVSTELVVMSQLLQPLLSKQGLEEMDLFKRGASPKILLETISSVGEGHIVVQCIKLVNMMYGGGHVKFRTLLRSTVVY